MVRYWPLIVKNTLRNRRRSALTILSIARLFCLLGVLIGMLRVLGFHTRESSSAFSWSRCSFLQLEEFWAV
jgi:hypothetical protein